MNRFYHLNPVCPESISNKRVHVFPNIKIRIFEVLLYTLVNVYVDLVVFTRIAGTQYFIDRKW